MIELLVVILIIGILAVISLPNMVEQRDKGLDAQAKADGRNAVTHVEACYSESNDFRDCSAAADLGPSHGLTLGTNNGEVEIRAFSRDTYRVTARSRTGNSFTLERANAGAPHTRSCTVAAGRPSGGCRGGSW